MLSRNTTADVRAVLKFRNYARIKGQSGMKINFGKVEGRKEP